MQLRYNGQVEITHTCEGEHRAVMRARAIDERGQGTAEATITTTLAEVDGRTEAETVTDLALTGRVARMSGIVTEVSNRLFERFTECVSDAAALPDRAEVGTARDPIRGFGLAREVLGSLLRRLRLRRGKS
jgi:carbon monoxide dehydrogenase subunit G